MKTRDARREAYAYLECRNVEMETIELKDI